MTQSTKMRREIDEIPAAVDRLLTQGAADIASVADAVRGLDPAFVMTVARGSSDHVCTYLKYVSEILLGVPVASVGPSVGSIYDSTLKLNKGLSVAVSQSGQSPDIVAMAGNAGRDGALTVALTNDAGSPLAQASAHTLNIHAGPELSVAATKTFVTSAVAGLWLMAEWDRNTALLAAIRALPKQLEAAAQINWPEVREAIGAHQSLFTLGRGQALAVSNEAALKFKETCQLHAESYSSAEVLHGPVSIVGEGFPVLGFAAADAAEGALADISDQIAAKGAQVFATTNRVQGAACIDHIRTDHGLTDPLSLIVSFYSMVEAFATSRGIDPDAPRHLKKVTETV
ncbi:SIS domain-containing protein [Parasedimentitalea maritima]|uniref:SIS domain-containing protein n=1 Tax=Parasedimentitalea maritima TaxID=2578117 RepID=A0A5R8Z1H7_9RHOB|nr:SIS domain-containing protein [Zongyanglinia marina]KAE9628193.1 SIS domain-containing protein [Zongyanglinia marina]TLP59404.1 SIS domain-containing protein [Zongyanglinia marina]